MCQKRQAKNTVTDPTLSFRETEVAPGRWWVVAVAPGGESIGSIRFEDTGEGSIWNVTRLRVDAAYRGQGVAKELHRRAVLIAQQRGGLLRALGAPDSAHAEVWQKLRAQRILIEGAEIAPGVSTIDRYVRKKGNGST